MRVRRAGTAAEDVRRRQQDPQLLQSPGRKWTRRASAATDVAKETATPASVPGGTEKSPSSAAATASPVGDSDPSVAATCLPLSTVVVVLLEREVLLRPLDGLHGIAHVEAARVPELPEALLRDRAQPHPGGNREERGRGGGMSVRKVGWRRSSNGVG